MPWPSSRGAARSRPFPPTSRCRARRDGRLGRRASSNRSSTRSSRTSRARAEVGAAVCVYVDGEPVVDLWGGVADTTTGRPWQSDTVVPVFSSSKGVTAVGANLLIERGRLDPDATVATYWPEFAANGKDAITVAADAQPSGRPATRRRRLHARRRARVGSDRRADRTAGADVGTGDEARLPHADLRVDQRRDHPPHHGASRPASSSARRSRTRSGSTSGSGSRKRSSRASRASSRRRSTCARSSSR